MMTNYCAKINWFSAVIVCELFLVFPVLAGPTQINAAEKPFRNEATHPSLHITLLSIEDKLRNLESTLSVQCTAAISGKIDYYGRKIDNIERDLSRFQVHMRMELDKISENISSKNYKDDITQDRIVRKIDAIYERINHRLGNIEGQIDITDIKSQNAREMVLSKLEKLEDSLTIRDADMEAELADSVAAIDDLKTTCTNMEENIINATKESTKAIFKNNEKSIRKQLSQTINIVESTNRSLSENIANIHHSLNLLLNHTNNSSMMKLEEFDYNFNDYANKISDMYSDLWQKTASVDNSVQNLAKVANLTRNEQQNGLRALMVQVGRKSGKQGVQSDSSIDSQKLAELSQKIDSNFENVMLAQNLFLESCHRVQMDESQLESQISIVLEKLIDIFENKTSVGPKDIEKLGQLIRTHDSNIRRSIYHITNNLLALMQKTSEGKDEIISYIDAHRLQLEAVHLLLQEVLNLDDSERSESILDTLQSLQQQLNKTHKETNESLSQINSTSSSIIKMLNTSTVNSETNNAQIQQTLEFIKNIYHVLTSIEMKVNKSYLDYFFNKYNIDTIAHRFGKRLNQFIQSVEGTNVTKQERDDGKTVPELLLEIFGEGNSEGQPGDPYDDYPYVMGRNVSKLFNQSGEEIAHVVLLCNDANASADCDEINNTKYRVIKQNETENLPTDKSNNNNKTSLEKPGLNNCLPNYIDLIDVRSNYGTNFTLPNCSLTLITTDVVSPIDNSKNNATGVENPNNTNLNNCLPNYIDLIDVRSNDGTNLTLPNCTLSNITTNVTDTSKTNKTSLEKPVNSSLNNCLPNYVDLIDVRSNDGTNNTSNCNITQIINITQDNTNNSNNNDDEESYDIDVRYGTSEVASNNSTEGKGPQSVEDTIEEATETFFDAYFTDPSNDQESTVTETWLPTTNQQILLNEISQEISSDSLSKTVKKFLNTAEDDSLMVSVEKNSVSGGNSTDGLETTTTEDSYALNSSEDDSSQTNEFEYTNHEYS